MTNTGISHAQDISSPGLKLQHCDQLAPSQHFLALYPNRAKSIIRFATAKNWITVSKFHTLSDEELLTAVSGQDKFVRGLRWDDQTPFLVLDIDRGSEYHNQNGLNKLRQSLWNVGITQTKLYQSSSSGGWHLYVMWYRTAPAYDVHDMVKKYLLAEGFTIRGGILEIFPSGNGLRLPLQPGFAWLDENGNTTTRREDLTADQAISRFVQDVESNAVNWQEVTEKITAQLELRSSNEIQAEDRQVLHEMVDDALSRIERSRFEQGRKYWSEGLTAKNQRHEAVLYVGYYLWFGDPSAGIKALPGLRNASRREQLLKQWIREKHNGFCNHINRGNWSKVDDDIERATQWVRQGLKVKQHQPYQQSDRLLERQLQTSLTVDQMQTANEKRQRRAETKIRWAIKQLQLDEQAVSIKAVARLSGCSINTVRRQRGLLTTGDQAFNSPVDRPDFDRDQDRRGKKEDIDLSVGEEVKSNQDSSHFALSRIDIEDSEFRSSWSGGSYQKKVGASRPPP